MALQEAGGVITDWRGFRVTRAQAPASGKIWKIQSGRPYGAEFCKLAEKASAIHAHTIAEFDKDFLKDQVLASMERAGLDRPR